MYKYLLIVVSSLALSIISVDSYAQPISYVEKEQYIVDAVRAIKGDNDISLTILYPEGSLDNITPIAEAFTKNTDVDITFIGSPVADINTRMLLNAALESTDYDIALPATYGVSDLVEAGALYDLSAYARKHELNVDYEPSLHTIGDKYKNKFYGYQTDGDAYLAFYHKAWFNDPVQQKRYADKYGKALSLPSTWQELDQLMAFFHKPESGRYGGCLFRASRFMVWEWWMRFHASGSYPVNDLMQPKIAGPAGVSALQAMLDVTPFQHPAMATSDLVDNWDTYGKGNCFVTLGWGGTHKYVSKKSNVMRGNMLYAPPPQLSYFNWGWNYVVSNHSAHSEIAYLFSLYATLPESSTIAVSQTGFFDPFRTEHYDSPSVQKQYSAGFLTAHQQAMTDAIPDFYLEGQGRYMAALQEAITAALDGYVTPQEALDYAAEEWNNITDELGRERQIKQWLFLKSHYPDTKQ